MLLFMLYVSDCIDFCLIWNIFNFIMLWIRWVFVVFKVFKVILFDNCIKSLLFIVFLMNCSVCGNGECWNVLELCDFFGMFVYKMNVCFFDVILFWYFEINDCILDMYFEICFFWIWILYCFCFCLDLVVCKRYFFFNLSFKWVFLKWVIIWVLRVLYCFLFIVLFFISLFK